MNKKTLRINLSFLVVVAIMIGGAEFFHEREIIFPEVAAIAVGLFLAPKISWQVSKIRIFILISICAVIGLLISLLVPLPLWMKMALAFIVGQFILLFSRTSFAPLISAIVLPVLLGTESIVYPISAVILTGIVLGLSFLLEKFHIKEKENYLPLPLPQKRDYIEMLIRTLIAMVCIYFAIHFKFTFAVAPPMLVAFTEFTKSECKARKTPMKTVSLIFVCALAGSICRYVFTVHFGLFLAFSAVMATVILIFLLKWFKMYLPPAGALTILPMLIPQKDLLVYPFEVLVGISIFMGVAILMNKKEHTKQIKS